MVIPLYRSTFLKGYTLLELMIVVAIAGILIALAVPTFQNSALKAREAVLKQNLFTMRAVLDQFYADQGRYPQALSEVVEAGYIREIPIDPFTKSADTWEVTFEETTGEEEAGGIFNIHSGSGLVSLAGTPYKEW